MIGNKIRFLIYALGIFLCYFVYGTLQEKIMGTTFGQEGKQRERFTCVLVLTWLQCLSNAILAKVILMATSPRRDDDTRRYYYVASALTYLLAMVTANTALRWVSYPTQVVGKSAKPIPIMILGVLIGRKTYSWIRYACVVTIVVGVVLFMYKPNNSSTTSPSPPVPSDKRGLGVALLIFSLSMDGVLAGVEERIRSSSSPTGLQMMLGINFWSTLMLILPAIITGEAKEFVLFANRHPEICGYIALLALCGCLGQIFIFYMVTGFGALACSVVTTTRKFFNILFSVLYFGNFLILRQWMGAVLVFAALFIDMFFGKEPSESIEHRRMSDTVDISSRRGSNGDFDIIDNERLVDNIPISLYDDARARGSLDNIVYSSTNKENYCKRFKTL